MRAYAPILVLLAVVQLVFARPVRKPPVPKLFELAHLVFVGKVIGVHPLGITTTLSYPTLKGVTYQRLQADISVYGMLKGTNAARTVSVAVLAPLSGTSLGDGPAMVSLAKEDKFIFFLAPSSVQALYASVLAPYDEANAIFPLDRDSTTCDFSGVVSKDYMKQCQEKKALVWALVDANKNSLPKGLDTVRTKYRKEIQTQPNDYKITLEWKTYTNARGWSWDVPKDVEMTNSEPGASPSAAPPRR